MNQKLTKFICFLTTAILLCSCSPKGGGDAEKADSPAQAGTQTGTQTEAESDGQSPAGEGTASWRKTEIQKPEGAVYINSMNYLADGTLRINSSDADGQNPAVWDSRDNGGTWENADADTSLASDYGYHYSADGSLFIYDSTKLTISAGDGTESRSVSVNEEETISEAAMAGNTLAVLVYDQNSQLRLDVYDLSSMSCRTLENGELSEYLNSQSMGGIALDSSGGILYLTMGGTGELKIARYDLNQDRFSYLAESEEMARLLNPEEKNGLVNPNEKILLSIAVNGAEDKMVLRMLSPEDSQTTLYLCEKGIWEEEKTASEGTLRIYSLYGGYEIRQAASLFQGMHPELEVSFETGYTGEDGVTLSDAIRTLNTELMAGEGPDLLVLDGLPADSYAGKGLLEDVTDIVEPSKEKYFYNMISAYNDGGKIFKLPTAFSVPVLLGDEETLAAENRDELMKVFEKKEDAGIPFITPENLAGTAGSLFITSDILGETVDEGKLADFYKDLEKIASQSMSDDERQEMEAYHKMTYWAETLYPSGGFSPDLELYFGEAQAGVGRISIYENFIQILAVRREKGLSYQYLNRENGNYFVAESVLGINSTGKHPEAARQFLEYYLSGEAQETMHFGHFSIIRSVMESTDREKYISENGEFIGQISRKYTPEKVMNLYKITPDELQELITFFEGCSRPVRDDALVLRKVMEQADACLFGGKDPESAAKDVCSEVNLYLSE